MVRYSREYPRQSLPECFPVMSLSMIQSRLKNRRGEVRGKWSSRSQVSSSIGEVCSRILPILLARKYQKSTRRFLTYSYAHITVYIETHIGFITKETSFEASIGIVIHSNQISRIFNNHPYSFYISENKISWIFNHYHTFTTFVSVFLVLSRRFEFVSNCRAFFCENRYFYINIQWMLPQSNPRNTAIILTSLQFETEFHFPLRSRNHFMRTKSRKRVHHCWISFVYLLTQWLRAIEIITSLLTFS